MKRILLLIALLPFAIASYSQYEWDEVKIGPDAGEGKYWSLQTNVSDDFSYTTPAFASGGWHNRDNFGPSNQWYNFYHNTWDGPGYTYWDNSQVSVDGDNLVITVGYSSKTNKIGTYGEGDLGIDHGVLSGCVTSNNKVTYPVYVESSLSVANIELASCFWLLSSDDYEEIDIIENYGGVSWFQDFTHISHHSFIRGSNFVDYQPKDWNSWYKVRDVSNAGGWGPYCWNDGDRRYMIMGVNWIGPKHWEYYINSKLVRVMYYNAMATNVSGVWQYTYYNSLDANNNNMPVNAANGYSDVTVHTTSSEYNFATLQATSNASNGYSVIDPGWFMGRDDTDIDGNGVTQEAKGFTRELDIIINMESQSWLLEDTPNATDLADSSKNQMKVDWVRVYKPATGSVAATELKLDKEEFTAFVGATFELNTTVLPITAKQDVTWETIPGGIATVSNGTVNCIGSGNVAIVAKSDGGSITDTCYVNVMSEPIKGTLTFDNPAQYETLRIESGSTLKVTCHFTASSPLHTVDGTGVRVFLQQIDGNGDLVLQKIGTTADAANLANGTATASIRLRTMTLTEDLPAGNFYRLAAEFRQATNLGVLVDTIYAENIDNINIVAAGTSVDDELATDINIYPNPSEGIFNIECDKESTIEIFNIVGTKVFESEVSGGETLIVDIANFGTGVYIVKAGNSYEKIIIE